MSKIKVIKLKTFTLYAKDKLNKDYYFVLSVSANSLKAAREIAKPDILKLNRKYPHYQYEFKWEEDNV